MKVNKITLAIMGLAVACLLASCKKNENDNNNDSAEGKGFSAQTEQGNGNNRTHLNGTDVQWTSGDQILVANQGGAAGCTTLTYTLKGGGNTTKGTFKSHDENDAFLQPDYVAIYPATNAAGVANSISGTTATFNLPATQICKANSFAEKGMPMMAYSESQTLQFKNVLGGVCFPIVGEGLVTKIVLTSKANEALWGTCTASIEGGELSSEMEAYSNEAQKTITLDCGSGIIVSTTPKDFYVMVPEGTLASGFVVTVYNGEDVLYTNETNNDLAVTRNTVWKLENSIEVDALPDGALNGTFSVSATNKIYFSKGSLRYQPSTQKWRFAEPQYDQLHKASDVNPDGYVDVSNEYKADYTGWIELFGWGCTGYKDTEYNADQTCFMPYETATGDGSHYGPTGSEYKLDVARHSDWGYVNIENGGEGGWRLWDMEEVLYMMNLRDTPSDIRFAWAQIDEAGTDDDAIGIIIFPDEWDTTFYDIQHPNTFETTGPDQFYINVISVDDWNNILEPNGAMFMITPGGRIGTALVEPGSTLGLYWSRTPAGTSKAVMPNGPDGSNVLITMDMERWFGGIVRLVRDVPAN